MREREREGEREREREVAFAMFVELSVVCQHRPPSPFPTPPSPLSFVCSQEHQFPEFPCCRKAEPAKQQKTKEVVATLETGASQEANLTLRTNFLS